MSRIIFSAAILLCPVFSPAFWVFYIAAGLSDMLDGAVARKFNAVSKTGERLATAADAVFVAVCLIKVLPAVKLPLWLLVWIGMIALIRIINVISGLAIRKQFIALHTAVGKLTGALLFVLPLTIGLLPLSFTGGIVCAAATFLSFGKMPIKKSSEWLSYDNPVSVNIREYSFIFFPAFHQILNTLF